MRRSASAVARSVIARRGFSSAASTSEEKIVAAVLFERLPVVIPKIEPIVYAFQEFSFRWRQQYRRVYPDEMLDKAAGRGKGDYHIDYEPAPRITEADKTNDTKSLQRALDRRLYLLLYGDSYSAPDGKPVWHFPEKVYEDEDTLRQQFFFKSQVIATNKYDIKNSKDHVWVTKDELLEYFPECTEFLNKMIIS
ncbi:unnamed protein product [Rhodiola kirilowii]